ncbi:M20 family metallo-hydrolase [Paenibacillus campi]|uniref:M20 family metallo-hydrolase n=1 Tax=Paenibacillus campi TaxID=3106031 RepID=UPI002AFF511C|nr:M20 family metallo-hydrolase [Paenibacillus sp. SGZ-1014]
MAKSTAQTAVLLEQYCERLQPMLDWLAGYGADPQGGVSRLLYTTEWVDAQAALAHYMTEHGLDVFYDQAGNLTGRLLGTEPEQPSIATGSHIDTVIMGGKYDGAYGVVAAVLALAYLKEAYGQPKRTLEALSLAEEEGSRFPLTYWGSGNIAGKYTVTDLPSVHDRDGVTLAEAIQAAGFGAQSPYRSGRRELGAYIELHIEQGCVLERSGQHIGVVTGIVGQRRIEVRVTGESNHAGTTPMGWRSDSLACAAEMITEVRRSALVAGDPLVATVGNIQPFPGVSNVIAGETMFTLDIRHLDSVVLDEYTERLRSEFAGIAAREGMTLFWQENLRAEPVLMNADMIAELEQICHQHGINSRQMPSGAGHDAQIFGMTCPSAMIFVPSRDGISHNPLEYTAPEELVQGFRVLTQWLYQTAY